MTSLRAISVAWWWAMDLRQLNAVVAVADCGSFSAAADALHTVQSNVSTHVARLERNLGVPLIDRSDGCRLTEEGQAVVERARRINGELEAMVADVAAMRAEVIGSVRIGMIGTTARWLVPRLLEAMAELHPKAEIDGLRLIASLTFEGLGPAVLPATAVPADRQGPWRAVSVEGLPCRSVGIALRRKGRPAAPVRAVIGVLEQVVETGTAERA